ncbi:AP-3 complex subunit mu-1 [Tetranychus urticae]|uniref:AP-3 complex subunit mu-1 n=1 Tax=Tetranychus urticae TaxID=32264 RepID=UPI00077BD202|nr:AP-3 complex subunit mu-1 [Tetranychus urticae]
MTNGGRKQIKKVDLQILPSSAGSASLNLLPSVKYTNHQTQLSEEGEVVEKAIVRCVGVLFFIGMASTNSTTWTVWICRLIMAFLASASLFIPTIRKLLLLPNSVTASSPIDCGIKLSGLPDLSLSFINPRLFDDVSFHPCVRYRRWESERVLSFIPPDGNFRLMSYTIGAQNIVSIPIFVRHLISFREVGGGKMEIRVGPKQTNGRTLDGVVLEIPMPKTVLNVNLSPNQGKYSFDPVSKLLVWEIGRIETGKIPIIFGYL